MFNKSFKTEYVPIGKLTTHNDNPRIIKDYKFRELCDSIKNEPGFFEVRPILATPDGVVFAGNQRLQAAREIGLEEIPVVYMDIPPEKQRSYMLLDNRHSGFWDFGKLSAVFTDEELKLAGFEEHELAGLSKVDLKDTAENLEKTMDSYLEGNVKQIVLYFSAEQFDKIIPEMETLMDEFGVQSHTEAFLKLKEFYENTRTAKETS